MASETSRMLNETLGAALWYVPSTGYPKSLSAALKNINVFYRAPPRLLDRKVPDWPAIYERSQGVKHEGLDDRECRLWKGAE